MMAAVNFEKAAAEAPKNPGIRKVFETINSMAPKIEDYTPNPPANERPFVSPLAWAYFSALQTIVFGAIMRAKMLEIGVSGAEEFINTEHAKKLLKIVLPHQSAYIDKHGDSSYYYLIEELENNLLNELSNILDGKSVDQENVHRASEIMESVNKMRADTTGQNALI